MLSPGDEDRLLSEIKKYKNMGVTLPDWYTIADDLNLDEDVVESCGTILWGKDTFHPLSTPNVDVDPPRSVSLRDNVGEEASREH